MESDSFKALAAVLVAVALAAAGCSGSGPATVAAPTTENLPPYGPGAAALFDDTFSPDFFGLERPEAPDSDPKLRTRVQTADTILPARISTVTRDSAGGRSSFTLVLTATGAALRGSSSSEPLTLTVGPESPSFPWIESIGTDLVGVPLILLAKRYNDAGKALLHWHAEPDTPILRRAIERAGLLSEVR